MSSSIPTNNVRPASADNSSQSRLFNADMTILNSKSTTFSRATYGTYQNEEEAKNDKKVDSFAARQRKSHTFSTDSGLYTTASTSYAAEADSYDDDDDVDFEASQQPHAQQQQQQHEKCPLRQFYEVMLSAEIPRVPVLETAVINERGEPDGLFWSDTRDINFIPRWPVVDTETQQTKRLFSTRKESELSTRLKLLVSYFNSNTSTSALNASTSSPFLNPTLLNTPKKLTAQQQAQLDQNEHVARLAAEQPPVALHISVPNLTYYSNADHSSAENTGQQVSLQRNSSSKRSQSHTTGVVGGKRQSIVSKLHQRRTEAASLSRPTSATSSCANHHEPSTSRGGDNNNNNPSHSNYHMRAPSKDDCVEYVVRQHPLDAYALQRAVLEQTLPEGLLIRYKTPSNGRHNLVRIIFTPYITKVEKHQTSALASDPLVPLKERVSTDITKLSAATGRHVARVVNPSPALSAKADKLCEELFQGLLRQGVLIRLAVYYCLEMGEGAEDKLCFLWPGKLELRRASERDQQRAIQKWENSRAPGSPFTAHRSKTIKDTNTSSRQQHERNSEASVAASSNNSQRLGHSVTASSSGASRADVNNHHSGDGGAKPRHASPATRAAATATPPPSPLAPGAMAVSDAQYVEHLLGCDVRSFGFYTSRGEKEMRAPTAIQREMYEFIEIRGLGEPSSDRKLSSTSPQSSSMRRRLTVAYPLSLLAKARQQGPATGGANDDSSLPYDDAFIRALCNPELAKTFFNLDKEGKAIDVQPEEDTGAMDKIDESVIPPLSSQEKGDVDASCGHEAIFEGDDVHPSNGRAEEVSPKDAASSRDDQNTALPELQQDAASSRDDQNTALPELQQDDAFGEASSTKDKTKQDQPSRNGRAFDTSIDITSKSYATPQWCQHSRRVMAMRKKYGSGDDKVEKIVAELEEKKAIEREEFRSFCQAREEQKLHQRVRSSLSRARSRSGGGVRCGSRPASAMAKLDEASTSPTQRRGSTAALSVASSTASHRAQWLGTNHIDYNTSTPFRPNTSKCQPQWSAQALIDAQRWKQGVARRFVKAIPDGSLMHYLDGCQDLQAEEGARPRNEEFCDDDDGQSQQGWDDECETVDCISRIHPTYDRVTRSGPQSRASSAAASRRPESRDSTSRRSDGGYAEELKVPQAPVAEFTNTHQSISEDLLRSHKADVKRVERETSKRHIQAKTNQSPLRSLLMPSAGKTSTLELLFGPYEYKMSSQHKKDVEAREARRVRAQRERQRAELTLLEEGDRRATTTTLGGGGVGGTRRANRSSYMSAVDVAVNTSDDEDYAGGEEAEGMLNDFYLQGHDHHDEQYRGDYDENDRRTQNEADEEPHAPLGINSSDGMAAPTFAKTTSSAENSQRGPSPLSDSNTDSRRGIATTKALAVSASAAIFGLQSMESDTLSPEGSSRAMQLGRDGAANTIGGAESNRPTTRSPPPPLPPPMPKYSKKWAFQYMHSLVSAVEDLMYQQRCALADEKIGAGGAPSPSTTANAIVGGRGAGRHGAANGKALVNLSASATAAAPSSPLLNTSAVTTGTADGVMMSGGAHTHVVINKGLGDFAPAPLPFTSYMFVELPESVPADERRDLQALMRYVGFSRCTVAEQRALDLAKASQQNKEDEGQNSVASPAATSDAEDAVPRPAIPPLANTLGSSNDSQITFKIANSAVSVARASVCMRVLIADLEELYSVAKSTNGQHTKTFVHLAKLKKMRVLCEREGYCFVDAVLNCTRSFSQQRPPDEFSLF